MQSARVGRNALVVLTMVFFFDSVAPSSGLAQYSSNTSGLEEVSLRRIGAVAYKPFADAATVVKHALAKCGARRLCARGWDLVAISVEPPGDAAPAGIPVGFRVTVANLGSAPSPAAPARLGVGSASTEATIPELASGDTLVTIVPLKLDPFFGPQSITLVVDPDRLSGEKKSDNNYADGGSITAEGEEQALVEMPEVRIEPESPKRGQPLLVRVTVRNLNRAYQLEGAILTVEQLQRWGVQPTSARLELPAVPPLTDLTGVVTLRDFTSRVEPYDEPIEVTLETAVTSSSGTGLSAVRATYTVQP